MSLRTKLIQSVIHFNENIFFYPKLKKYYSTILTDDVFIIDVGSNKGQSIDFFLNINSNIKILGFEPNKKLFKKIESKYKHEKNVQLKNVGVSDVSGTLVFNENILDETSTFETLNFDSDYLKKKAKILGVKPEQIINASYEVPVITLDSIIDNESLTNNVIVKIDVEGHEFQCLKGLLSAKQLHKVKYIQLENHNDDMYASRVSFEEMKKNAKC
jgi:FkbM family methyltransferase